MIKGMTGFGTAQVSWGNIKGILEMKSQNHRYFDVVYYLPVGFSSLEDRIKKIVAQDIKRGRITIGFKINEKPVQHLELNKEVVHEYLKYANVLKKQFGLDNDLKLSDLFRMPGVITAKDTTLDLDKFWPFIERGLIKAMNSLVGMRKREGKSLLADISNVLKRMKMQTRKISQRVAFLLREKKKASSMDDFISYQKGADINEELSRLAHYIDEFKIHLKSQTTVGKKLDFVAQEMQRETNTIGSKVQDKEVANAVVSLKSKIEKLREQAQNIE